MLNRIQAMHGGVARDIADSFPKHQQAEVARIITALEAEGVVYISPEWKVVVIR